MLGKVVGEGSIIVAEMEIRNGTHTKGHSFPRKDAPNHSVFPIGNKSESYLSRHITTRKFFS